MVNYVNPDKANMIDDCAIKKSVHLACFVLLYFPTLICISYTVTCIGTIFEDLKPLSLCIQGFLCVCQSSEAYVILFARGIWINPLY